jgi:uncharacterized protein YndB with AHSA1/START domain
MPGREGAYPDIVKTIVIDASPSKVWDALTIPALIKQWMSETDIDIVTDWQVGQPIIIKGDWYKAGFKNAGTVLQFEPERMLQYSHLSSLSRLPDTEENHTVLSFTLEPTSGQTTLTLTASNFPTESIYRHFSFYWNVAIVLLKKFVEQ